jgi:hypothetical protein
VSYKKQELFILQELVCSPPVRGSTQELLKDKQLAVLLIYVITQTPQKTGDEHRSY